MTLHKDQIETAKVIQMESGTDVAFESIFSDVTRLTNLARRLRKIYTDSCNVLGADARDKEERARLEMVASAMILNYGLEVEFNGDPRGPAIRVKTPKTRRNNSLSGNWTIPE